MPDRKQFSREFVNYTKPNPKPPKSVQENQGLVIAGWITTFLLTPVGFIIGIILTAKGRWGHGVAIMVACVLYWFIVIAVVIGGAASEPTREQTREVNRQAMCDTYQWSLDVGVDPGPKPDYC